MDYREFTERFMEELRKQIGIPEVKVRFQEGDMTITDDSIVIYPPDDDPGPWKVVMRLKAKELYSDYCSCHKLEEMAKSAVKSIERSDFAPVYAILKKMDSFVEIKNHLFIKPLNSEKDARQISNAIIKRVGDICLTVALDFGVVNGSASSMLIPRIYSDKWCRSEEEVFQAALQNMIQKNPPTICDCIRTLYTGSCCCLDLMTPDSDALLQPTLMAVSTKYKYLGAVAAFYPGVLKYISTKLGEEKLYLVFTSKHEVLIHGSSIFINPGNMKTALQGTIDECVDGYDFLTSNIYQYELEQDKISMVEF